jgi:hypothetical protein
MEGHSKMIPRIRNIQRRPKIIANGYVEIGNIIEPIMDAIGWRGTRVSNNPNLNGMWVNQIIKPPIC